MDKVILVTSGDLSCTSHVCFSVPSLIDYVCTRLSGSRVSGGESGTAQYEVIRSRSTLSASVGRIRRQCFEALFACRSQQDPALDLGVEAPTGWT